jgi:ketosteroid isomerase-like protein
VTDHGTAEEHHVVAAHALLDAIGAHDRERLASLVGADARWWFQPSVARPDAPRSVAGRDAIVAAVIPPHPAFEKGSTSWTILHEVQGGDLLAVHAERRATGSRGQPYHVEYHFLFRYEGDQIAEVWDIMDTAAAFAQLGGEARAAATTPG